MLSNGNVTIYHKGYDEEKNLEKWIRFNYSDIWFFGGKGAGVNKGYDNANDFDCRIPYDKNSELDIRNFAIGDIVVQGTLEDDIESQQDLDDYLFYNITSINNNNFGSSKHIHIGGK
jgi:hypothetical protein